MIIKCILTRQGHYHGFRYFIDEENPIIAGLFRFFGSERKYSYVVEFFKFSSMKKYDEMRIWNNQNLKRKWLLVDYCTVIFEDDEDAMAFKLRWT